MLLHAQGSSARAYHDDCDGAQGNRMLRTLVVRCVSLLASVDLHDVDRSGLASPTALGSLLSYAEPRLTTESHPWESMVRACTPLGCVVVEACRARHSGRMGGGHACRLPYACSCVCVCVCAYVCPGPLYGTSPVASSTAPCVGRRVCSVCSAQCADGRWMW